MIIAIDGHSSCGKSSFAKMISAELDFLYIDSGAMYRAVTLFSIENHFIINKILDKEKLLGSLENISIEFEHGNDHSSRDLLLNGANVEEKIRGMEVSSFVSEVSRIKEVRERMVILQRELSRNRSVVMDGRDIGTVVFPDAELKIFMTASLEVRAERRFLELQQKGKAADFDQVMNNLAERDRIDQSRDVSPLKKADDAYILDNSEMTMEDQMVWFRKLWEEKNFESIY